jgi:hypothetical protein
MWANTKTVTYYPCDPFTLVPQEDIEKELKKQEDKGWLYNSVLYYNNGLDNHHVRITYHAIDRNREA